MGDKIGHFLNCLRVTNKVRVALKRPIPIEYRAIGENYMSNLLSPHKQSLIK